ncbi:hypothetical protein [Streptomyces fungicidicus]|uniref:hypothetical protein n=1 Tax=Streptomyces fungicidicus TaxID=68203 RepID=UPI0037F3C4BC
MDITWHKDAAGSYYATHDGKRIATARKDGNAWHGTVVGLGHGFTGRRLADAKELAHRHVERIYGEGEWTLFPARDLKPGMVLGCDTWKDGDREVTSVSVDTDAQAVDVELSSESSRELGFALDHTYAVGEYVRVRPQDVEIVRAEHLAEGDALWFYEGKGIVTAVEPVGNNLGQLRVTTLFKGEYGTVTVYPGSTFERVRKAEEAEQTLQASGGDVFEATEPVRVEDVTPGMKLVSKNGTVTEVTRGAEILRDGWQKGKVRHSFRTLSESLCTGGSVTLPVGTVLHRIVETEQAPQVRTLDDPADAEELAEFEADQRDAKSVRTGVPAVDLASEVERCSARRPGRHRLPCILPAGHSGLHRDALSVEWSDAPVVDMPVIEVRQTSTPDSFDLIHKSARVGVLYYAAWDELDDDREPWCEHPEGTGDGWMWEVYGIRRPVVAACHPVPDIAEAVADARETYAEVHAYDRGMTVPDAREISIPAGGETRYKRR